MIYEKLYGLSLNRGIFLTEFVPLNGSEDQRPTLFVPAAQINPRTFDEDL